jgi:class 3 adenylate cyclase
MTVAAVELLDLAELVDESDTDGQFALLNALLGRLEPVVVAAGGFVAQYAGGTLLTVFDCSASTAVGAGLTLVEAIQGLNDERRATGQAPVSIRVSMNTGDVLVGAVGTQSRLSTTVVSDAVRRVHAASSAAAEWSVTLAITQSTFDAMDTPGERAGRLVGYLRGDGIVTGIHELFDAVPLERRAAKSATRVSFERAVRSFSRGRFVEARAQFAVCAALDASDPAIRWYLARCDSIEAQMDASS